MKIFITVISVYLAVALVIAMMIIHYFSSIESGGFENLDTVQTLMTLYRITVISLGVIVLCFCDWWCIRNYISIGWTLLPFPLFAATIMADQWFAWKWYEAYKSLNPGNDDLFFGGFLSLFWLFIILLAAVVNLWFLMTVMKYHKIRSVKSL